MSETKVSTIGAVVVNYHSEGETRRTASQLTESCSEIVIVDNSAPSEELEKWVSEQPAMTYIDSGGNVGYAAANNVGLRALATDYYFIVNPDVTLPDSEVPQKLAGHLRENPEIGIIAPAIGTAPPKNQHGDTATIRLLHLLGRLPELQKRDDCLVARTQVVGCAMMVPAEVIADIGPLDPAFFLYNEEIEFCYRAREAGYQVVYDSECRVEHEKDDGLSHPKPYQIYYRTRNIFLLGRRRFQGLTRILYYSAVLIVLFSVLVHKRWSLLDPWLRGLIDGFRGLKGETY